MPRYTTMSFATAFKQTIAISRIEWIIISLVSMRENSAKIYWSMIVLNLNIFIKPAIAIYFEHKIYIYPLNLLSKHLGILLYDWSFLFWIIQPFGWVTSDYGFTETNEYWLSFFLCIIVITSTRSNCIYHSTALFGLFKHGFLLSRLPTQG